MEYDIDQGAMPLTQTLRVEVTDKQGLSDNTTVVLHFKVRVGGDGSDDGGDGGREIECGGGGGVVVVNGCCVRGGLDGKGGCYGECEMVVTLMMVAGVVVVVLQVTVVVVVGGGGEGEATSVI